MIIRGQVKSDSENQIVGHKVILIERDLLLLEMILGHEPGGMSDKETINHIDVLYNQVHLMIKDY